MYSKSSEDKGKHFYADFFINIFWLFTYPLLDLEPGIFDNHYIVQSEIRYLKTTSLMTPRGIVLNGILYPKV